ncbi:MAG TPA: DoxX family protein [Gaiellaceae bacterium]|jgi:putative oxidoreductase|nr:DoxX family protein [Gaiellaceae bacterium]
MSAEAIHSSARPLIGLVFVVGGWSTLRKPKPRVELAEPVLETAEKAIPGAVRPSRRRLVQANAVAQLAAGLAFPFRRFMRPAGAVLAVSLVPATLGGHRFWEAEDEKEREQQLHHFLKNLAILGGLLLELDSGR